MKIIKNINSVLSFNIDDISITIVLNVFFHIYNFYFLLFSLRLSGVIEPSMTISNMEALLLNSSAVYLKWKAPPEESHNGKYKDN